jgi:hypothetical protein
MPQNVPAYTAPAGKTIGSFGLTTDVNAATAQVAALTEYANQLPATVAAAVEQRTGSVLRFDAEADYDELFATTFTVDITVRTPGIIVKALLAAGCSAIPLPSTDFEKVGGGSFVSGAAHLYVFSTSTETGKIQYAVSVRL